MDNIVWDRKIWFIWGVITFLALAISTIGIPYLLDQNNIIQNGFGNHLTERPAFLYLHFIFGPLALFIGSLNFVPVIRHQNVIFHRWLGRFYATFCLLGAVGGTWLGVNTEAGPIAAAGFSLMGVFWFVTTLKSWLAIREGDIANHRKWMTRSFSLTLAAVTLRLYMIIAGINGLDMEIAYVVISWACWVPNLIVAQIWLKKTPL